MSSQTMTTPATTTASGIGRARATVVAVLLTLGALASATIVLWQPWGERNDLSYETLAAHRDAAWLGAIIDGVATAAIGITLGLAVCLLARRRGAVLATVGSVVAGLGGVLFCAAIVSFGTLTWYVTDTGALAAPTGTAMMTYVEDNLGHVAAVQAPGFLLFTLGALLLMVALWRARAVPMWLPIAYVVLTVGVFVLDGTAINVVQAVQTLLLAVVSWFLLRATRA
jgi:hypothetical protein